MVQKPVESRRGQGLIPKHIAPVQEALVRGQDKARLLVSPTQKPEKEARFRGRRLAEKRYSDEVPISSVILFSVKDKSESLLDLCFLMKHIAPSQFRGDNFSKKHYLQ